MIGSFVGFWYNPLGPFVEWYNWLQYTNLLSDCSMVQHHGATDTTTVCPVYFNMDTEIFLYQAVTLWGKAGWARDHAHQAEHKEISTQLEKEPDTSF